MAPKSQLGFGCRVATAPRNAAAVPGTHPTISMPCWRHGATTIKTDRPRLTRCKYVRAYTPCMPCHGAECEDPPDAAMHNILEHSASGMAAVLFLQPQAPMQQNKKVTNEVTANKTHTAVQLPPELNARGAAIWLAPSLCYLQSVRLTCQPRRRRRRPASLHGVLWGPTMKEHHRGRSS
jgi:hypothetical protein